MKKSQKILVIPHGVISEVAKKAEVSRLTARQAILFGSNGTKSRLCRKIFEEEFLPQITNFYGQGRT